MGKSKTLFWLDQSPYRFHGISSPGPHVSADHLVPAVGCPVSSTRRREGGRARPGPAWESAEGLGSCVRGAWEGAGEQTRPDHWAHGEVGPCKVTPSLSSAPARTCVSLHGKVTSGFPWGHHLTCWAHPDLALGRQGPPSPMSPSPLWPPCFSWIAENYSRLRAFAPPALCPWGQYPLWWRQG